MSLIALLTACTALLGLPLTAGVLRSRPLTDLDRRLSAVDVDLDGRR